MQIKLFLLYYLPHYLPWMNHIYVHDMWYLVIWLPILKMEISKPRSLFFIEYLYMTCLWISISGFCPDPQGNHVAWWVLYQQKSLPFIHFYSDSENNHDIKVINIGFSYVLTIKILYLKTILIHVTIFKKSIHLIYFFNYFNE